MIMRSGHRIGYLVAFVVLMLGTVAVRAQSPTDPVPKLTPAEIEDWRADLKFLADELPRRHKNLFFSMTRGDFENAVKRLDAKIPTLTRQQVALELQRIVAMVRDGHTWLLPEFSPNMGFHSLPLKLYVFRDGVFVQKASPEYANLVGGKVLKIGTMPIERAIATLSPYLPKENEMGERNFAPLLLVSPEVLHALAITPDPASAEFQIEKDGKTSSVVVKLDPNFQAMRGVHAKVPDNWIDARGGSKNPTPLWLKDPDNKFWFEYLKDSKTMYVQLNEMLNKDDKTIAQFFDEVRLAAESNGAERLVLDIRQNGGGNNGLAPAVVRGLVQLRNIDQRGKLFVIIGRQTFSAAQNLTNVIELFTNAIFVGEPTASHVNMYGDAARFTLPKSKIIGQASTLWWQNMSERDTRKWTAPEIAAELTFDDYANNVDTAMKAILDYTPRKSLREIAMELYAAKDLNAFRARVVEYRDDPVNAYRNIESEVNTIGYRLLQMKKPDEAVEIFKINVELYPDSANAYDSLAEGYMNQGNRELAIKFYKKSLELDPKNASAAATIERLEKGNL